MKKIEWIPATLQKKAMMIQATCWPLALYTTDTTYLGQQHFTALRRAVVSTLVGYWHTSSPFLTCSMLSRHVSDPFLFTLMHMFQDHSAPCKCPVGESLSNHQKSCQFWWFQTNRSSHNLQMLLEQCGLAVEGGWHSHWTRRYSVQRTLRYHKTSDKCSTLYVVNSHCANIRQEGIGRFFN